MPLPRLVISNRSDSYSNEYHCYNQAPWKTEDSIGLAWIKSKFGVQLSEHLIYIKIQILLSAVHCYSPLLCFQAH